MYPLCVWVTISPSISRTFIRVESYLGEKRSLFIFIKLQVQRLTIWLFFRMFFKLINSKLNWAQYFMRIHTNHSINLKTQFICSDNNDNHLKNTRLEVVPYKSLREFLNYKRVEHIVICCYKMHLAYTYIHVLLDNTV